MSTSRIMDVRKTLSEAERASGSARREALTELGAEIRQQGGPEEARNKAAMLADAVSRLAAAGG
jgi:hypothetical protein